MAVRPSLWPDSRLLELLRRLHLGAGRSSFLWAEGRRRFGLRGASMEIADFRTYVQGDDLSHIDWKVLARLDQLVVRLFHARRAAPVTLMLDASASMAFGRPRKFDFARSLAAALGFLALHHQDPLLVLSATGAPTSPAARRAEFSAVCSLPSLLAHLRNLEPRGRLDLGASLESAVAGTRRGGLFMIISDFFPPGDWSRPLRRLLAAGQDLVLLHTLAPQELRPEFSGPQRLRDSESGAVLPLTPNRRLLREYQRRLDVYINQLADAARGVGAAYLLVDTSTSLENLLLRDWRLRGIVRL